MKIPTTYADWLDCFDLFAAEQEDEAVLAAMEKGSIEWSTGIDRKMTEHMYRLLELRLKKVSTLMNKELGRLSGQTDLETSRAMLHARKRFAVLIRLVALQAFPEDVRNAFGSTLSAYVKDTQEALEKGAEADRSGHLKMIIRNNSLLRYEEEATEQALACNNVQDKASQKAVPHAGQNPPDKTNTKRRRVLL